MVLTLLCYPFSYSYANDTVLVSGGIQHDGLLDWSPVKYHSNSYLDLSVHWHAERKTFRELRATTRLELTQWPLLGYESDFGGHGVGHLSLEAAFTWGKITIGDVYGQFGSGLILDLYEDRGIGIDGALRGAKITLEPYKGSQLQMIEKQLEIIHRRSDAVEDFTNEEKERMENLLKLYSEGMKELQGKLQRAMDDQMETIEQAHSDYQKALKSKCNSFLDALDEAFNTEEMAANFRYLENLVSIDRHLSNLTSIEEQLRQLQEMIEKKEDTTEAIRHLERTAAVLVSNRKFYSNSIETRHETVQSAEKHGRKVNNWWNKIVFWK